MTAKTPVLDALKSKFGDAIIATSSDFGDDSATVDPGKLVEVATWLRDERGHSLPLFVTAIDRLGQPSKTPVSLEDDGDDDPRFEVVFQVRSLSNRETIRLKVLCGDVPKVPSLTGVWRAFNWQERETYDMYGVHFEGHPDLRRIYMYEEFVGYPLRKDYPKDKRQPLVRREWTDEVTDFQTRQEPGGQGTGE